MYLDTIKHKLEERRIIPPDTIIPCSQEEVMTLEQRIGRALPQAYREFLLWMGHGAGAIMRGSDCFYESLIYIQRDAGELLEENMFPEPLPSDAFVFLMHQGYQFDFFRLSDGEDPQVYYYLEVTTQGTFSLVYPHYSDFLSAVIESELDTLEKFAKHPTQTLLTGPPSTVESIRYYRREHNLDNSM